MPKGKRRNRSESSESQSVAPAAAVPVNSSLRNTILFVVIVAVVAVGAIMLLNRASAKPELTASIEKVPTPAQTPSIQPSIPRMLLEINKKLDPHVFTFLNAERARLIRADLDDKSKEFDPMQRRNLEVTYACELLYSGKSEDALKACQATNLELKTNEPQLYQQISASSKTFEAICNLRIGEQLNCCARNNQNSCLVPISGAGVHSKQEGSRNAIKVLTECLTTNPDDIGARWLINIAYMTLGEYPDKVPKQWLIPLQSYGADYKMKKFFNAAPQLGLDLEGWAGSIVMEDFEDRGVLDLLVSSWKIDGQMRYIRNNGDGTFTERTKESGLLGEIGGLNMITTDYNNDGRPDVLVLRGGWFEASGNYPMSLLRNDGGGHFTDVTIEAGLLNLGPTQTAVSFDYNNDGYLDLFVGYESNKNIRASCKLFRNNGNGTFTDATVESKLDIYRFVKGVVSADFTRSGRPGLYLSCLNGPNILLRNDGPAGSDASPMAPWKFTDISATAGVSLQNSTFSCFFFDYDNDGWPDLYVGGYGGMRSMPEIAKDYLGMPTTATKAKLYRNKGDGTFADISKEAHLDKVNLGMGINFGDLDNDGWLDFYVGTGSPDLEMLIPNRMFRNHDGKYFDEVTTTADFGHLQKGHGISFADIDNNGQQDVFLVAGGALEGDVAHDCLFMNPGHDNHWITLKLTGVKSNRIAQGAVLCVTVATPDGERKIYRTVGSGGSFGCNPLRREIGLGNASGIKDVSIRWPSSAVPQTISGLEMDRFYKIKEGASSAELWNVPAIKLNFRDPAKN